MSGDSDQNHHKQKKCTKAKWLAEETLHIAEGRRKVKSKGERVAYTQLNAKLQRLTSGDKAFLKKQCKVTRYHRRLSQVGIELSDNQVCLSANS